MLTTSRLMSPQFPPGLGEFMFETQSARVLWSQDAPRSAVAIFELRYGLAQVVPGHGIVFEDTGAEAADEVEIECMIGPKTTFGDGQNFTQE